MALFVIKVAREGAADDVLLDPLAERIIAVADGQPGAGDAGAPAFRVVAVAVGAIAEQQAHRVIAVADGLGAALALQLVAAGADGVVVSRGVVQDFTGAVAVQVVAVVDAALGRFAPLAAGQAVESVVVVPLVQAGVAVIGHLDEAAGRVVAIVTAVGQLGGIEAQAGEHGPPGQVVEALVRLAIAPGPAVDLAVRFIADLADQRLAIDRNGIELAVQPDVAEGLAARRNRLLPLALRIVAVAGSQRIGADRLGLAGNAALAVVAVADRVDIVGQAAQPADAVGAGVPGVGDGLGVVNGLGDAVEAVVAVDGGLVAGIGAGLDIAGGVIGKTGGAGVGADLAGQIAKAVDLVLGGESARIGDAGELAQAVISRIDLALRAADESRMRLQLAHRLIQGVILMLADASERIGDLGQVAVGIVLEIGHCRRRERGADEQRRQR